MQNTEGIQNTRISRMELSIVATMYKSANFVQQFYRRITQSAASLVESYEIILVDDGSPDDSLKIALDLARVDPHIRVIELSRNFGHHTAILAGLRYTRGNFVFLIDIDLEEQPEWLID